MDRFGGGWVGHAARIEAAWRDCVGTDDTVLVPGDVSWAMKPADAAADLALLASLPGRKFVTRGNHDYWWPKTEAKLGVLLAPYPSLRLLPSTTCAVVEGFALAGTRFWKLPSDEYWDEAKDRATYDKELRRLAACCAALRQAPAGTTPVLVLHHPPHDLRDPQPSAADALIRAAGIRRVYYGHLHPAPEAGLVSFPYEKDGVVCQLIAVDSHDFTPQPVAAQVTALPLAHVDLSRFAAHSAAPVDNIDK